MEFMRLIEINSADQILNLIIFTNEDIQGYAENAQFVTDDNALLEFSTGSYTLSTDPNDVIEDINKFLEENEEN